MDATTLLRRLALWTVVCSVSAAPSFVFAASDGFDQVAMVAAVSLFVLAYTAVTSMPWFERFHALPFVRRTLYVGYGLRLLVSLAFPLTLIVDVLTGMISVGLVESLRVPPKGFGGTFLITCVHGTITNMAIGVVMLIAYWAQRLTRTPPAERDAGRAFEVIMPAPGDAR